MTLASASHRNNRDCAHATLNADILIGGGHAGQLVEPRIRGLQIWEMEAVVDRPFVWRPLAGQSVARWQPWNHSMLVDLGEKWRVLPESLCAPGVRMILLVNSTIFGHHAINLACADNHGPLLYDTTLHTPGWSDGIPLDAKRAQEISISAFMVTSDPALLPRENPLTRAYIRACRQRAHASRSLG